MALPKRDIKDAKQAAAPNIKTAYLHHLLLDLKKNYKEKGHQQDVDALNDFNQFDTVQKILIKLIQDFKSSANEWIKDNKDKNFADYINYLSTTTASMKGHHYTRMIGMILREVNKAFPDDMNKAFAAIQAQGAADSQSFAALHGAFNQLKTLEAPMLKKSMYAFIKPFDFAAIKGDMKVSPNYTDMRHYLAEADVNPWIKSQNRTFDSSKAQSNNVGCYDGPLDAKATLVTIEDLKTFKQADLATVQKGISLINSVLPDLQKYQDIIKDLPKRITDGLEKAYIFAVINRLIKPKEKGGVIDRELLAAGETLRQIANTYFKNKNASPEQCLASLMEAKAKKDNLSGKAVTVATREDKHNGLPPAAQQPQVSPVKLTTAAVFVATPTESPRSRSSAISEHSDSENTAIPMPINIILRLLNDINIETRDDMKAKLVDKTVAVIFDEHQDFLKEVSKYKIDPIAADILKTQFNALIAERNKDLVADPKSLEL